MKRKRATAPALPGLTSTTTPAGIAHHDRDVPAWVCRVKRCRAIHYYKPECCQSCGGSQLIETISLHARKLRDEKDRAQQRKTGGKHAESR
ncbi:MAG: hypothetical protein KGL39_32685 [Patescibacteria group bacterium]|nr:hypothetical protein [Patescibacteria group bacterium]